VIKRTLIVLILVCGGFAFVAAAPASAQPADPHATLLGDSTMAALVRYQSATYDYAAILNDHYDVDLDAISCRGLIRSCGRTPPPTTLAEMRERFGRLGEAVVVMAGYDESDINASVDAVMTEAVLQSVPRVIFLTYRTTTTYKLPGGMSAAGLYEKHNATLARKARQWPTLKIADWDAYTRGMANGCSGCNFAADGIHLTPTGAIMLAHFIVANMDLYPMGRCEAARHIGDAAAPSSTEIEAPAGGFTPVDPVRVVDTRSFDAEDPGRTQMLGAQRQLTVDLSAIAPQAATSALVNLTAVEPCGNGWLVAYPCATGVPNSSNLNYVGGRTVANLASVMLSDDELCVWASSATDVLVDVSGWFVSGAGTPFATVAPDRLVDTRPGFPARLDQVEGLRGAGSTLTVSVAGQGEVPANATAVLVNITATQPQGSGWITAYPCGITQPWVSNVNYDAGLDAGLTVPNAAAVRLDAQGRICVFTQASTHLIIDVFGWFGPNGASRFIAQSPLRITDTRGGIGGPAGMVPANTPKTFDVQDSASLVNVTVVSPVTAGWATDYPCGAVPNVSNSNFLAGEVEPALAVVRPGVGGKGCVIVTSTTHVLVDRMGRFVPLTG